jgi:hypothetical protein
VREEFYPIGECKGFIWGSVKGQALGRAEIHSLCEVSVREEVKSSAAKAVVSTVAARAVKSSWGQKHLGIS